MGTPGLYLPESLGEAGEKERKREAGGSWLATVEVVCGAHTARAEAKETRSSARPHSCASLRVLLVAASAVGLGRVQLPRQSSDEEEKKTSERERGRGRGRGRGLGTQDMDLTARLSVPLSRAFLVYCSSSLSLAPRTTTLFFPSPPLPTPSPSPFLRAPSSAPLPASRETLPFAALNLG